MKTLLGILVLLLMPVVILADTKPADCVYARDVQQFEILNDRILLLIGRLDRRWVNRLNTRCAGLRKNMVLNISRFGSQICANDRITATSRGAVLGEGPVAHCRLGKFEAVSPEQVAALRQSLTEADQS